MTPIQISVAILMLGATVAIFVWLQRNEAAASGRRMTAMMTRFGLDPRTAALGDPRTEVIMKEAQRRCGKCRFEGFCERWLTGKGNGDNTFCPNAQTFRILAGTGGRTA